MKLHRLFFPVAIAVALLASPALADPNFVPFRGQPVIDSADVIPADREAALNLKLRNYERTTGHQLAVVTVTDLEGYDIETYANEYFRFLQLGDADVDDGVLYLFAPSERQMRIEVGYGLEPILTDAQAALILQNEVKPFTRRNDFPGAIETATNSIMAATQMDQAAVEELRAKKAAADKAASERFWSGVGDFFLFVLGAGTCIGLCWLLLDLSIYRPKRRREQALRKKLQAEERARYAEMEAVREAERATRREFERQKAEQRRQQEAERIRLAAEARERKLAAMTPTALAAFLAHEENERQAAVRREQIATAQRRKQEEQERERRRKRDEEDRERRRRDDDDRRRRDDSYGGGYGGSSSSNDYSGGGGSSGGGGASSGFD